MLELKEGVAADQGWRVYGGEMDGQERDSYHERETDRSSFLSVREILQG